MKKIIMITVITIMSLVLLSTPFDYTYVDSNPALSKSKIRNIINVGVNADLQMYQSFVKTMDVFTTDPLVIDLNEIYNDLDGSDAYVGLSNNDQLFTSLNLWLIEPAVSLEMDNKLRLTIPNEMIKFLAEGYTIEEELTGEGEIYINSKIEASSYLPINLFGHTWGVEVSKFLPVLNTDTTFDFSVNSNIDDASMDVSASMNAPLYSFLSYEEINDFGNIDPNNITNSLLNNSGWNLSFGTVKYDAKKPKYGISINNISLTPARVNKYEASFSASVTAENIVFSQEEEPFSFNMEDIEYTQVGELEEFKDIASISGFFNFRFLFDWYPYLEYSFDSNLNIGTYARGNLFFIPYWLNFGYDQSYYNLKFGTGINLYLAEITTEIGTYSPKISKLFDLKGISAKINLAVGF
jgi:hypothetical protein